MTQQQTPMDCEKFDKIALDLLYEELDELSAAAARRHLHHCTRCKNIFSSMHATAEVGVLPMVEPPAGLRQRILEAERHAHKQFSLRERMGRSISVLAGYAMGPQWAMAALLLLMVGTSLVFLRARPSDHDKVGVTERGAPALEREPLPAVARLDDDAAEMEEFQERSRSSARAPAGAAPRKAEAPAAEDAAPAPAPMSDFQTGMAAYQASRYAEAERRFAAAAAAGGTDAPSAALYEAHAARNGSGCQRAAALYDAVAGRYPSTTVADEASWNAASCYRSLGQLERAKAHYRALALRPSYAERAQAALSAVESSQSAVAAKRAAGVGQAASVKAPAATAGAAPAAAADETKGADAPAEAAPAAPPAAPGAAPAPSAPAEAERQE